MNYNLAAEKNCNLASKHYLCKMVPELQFDIQKLFCCNTVQDLLILSSHAKKRKYSRLMQILREKKRRKIWFIKKIRILYLFADITASRIFLIIINLHGHCKIIQ